MKHLPAILFIAAAVLCGSVSAPAQAEPILDFAVRVGCDFQQPELGLMDLHVLQGSTPLVLAMPKAGNTALTPDPDTGVRMIIGPSDTGSIYAVRTNYAIAGGGYAIDWPTIGTNSSGQAWFYTLLFDRDGKTYWSGSGALYIDASGYTGPDGVEWIEYTTPNVGWPNIIGDPADNTALVDYVAAHGGGSSVGGWTNLAFSGSGNAITNATAAGTTLTLERGTVTESDPLYSAWATNGPGATNAILADGSLVSIDGWGSGIPPDGLALASVAAFDAGTATIDLGSNWCWRLVADTDCTAINFSVASVPEGDIVPNTVKAILLEVSRGESAAWAWGGHLSHITNDAPAAGSVSHLLLIAPSQDVTATNGWTVF